MQTDIESVQNKILKLLGNFDFRYSRIYGDTYLTDLEEPEFDKFKRVEFSVFHYSGFPYYCPNGWRRYSLKVDDFDKYSEWPVAYCGTNSNNLLGILIEGFKTFNSKSELDCIFLKEDFYFSPSINYCAHPKFTTSESSKSSRMLFYQVVLQCRIKPDSFLIKSESLLKDKSIIIDRKFNNDELEWVIPFDYKYESKKRNEKFIIISGIMVNLTKEHPKKLFKNKWWDHSNFI